MASVKPYKTSVPDSELSSLRQKLSEATFPSELSDSDWDYGSPLADIKRLTAYWKDSFDWRKAEAKLNEVPQYTTTIQAEGFDALNIHFVHQQSKVNGAIPLLFVHGCECYLCLQLDTGTNIHRARKLC